MSGREQVEPGALESKIDRGGIDQHTAWASMAISLKRIADALSPPASSGDGAPALTAYELLDTIADVLTGKGPQEGLYGMATDLAFHMGQAFERGRGSA